MPYSLLAARRLTTSIRNEMVRGQLFYSAAAAGGGSRGFPGAALHIQPTRDASTKQIEQSLPRLPVPDPARTLSHFINFAAAIESPKEHRDTLKVIEKFTKEELPYLQKLLEERATKHNNWLTPWWLNIAYLNSRTPLPVVTSPGVLFPKFDYQGIEGQIAHAAKIAQAALFFHRKIQNGQLAVDKAGSAPLDMSQYRFLFGTNRVPGIDMDKICYGCDAKTPAEHIAVSRNGNFWKVPVLRDGRILSLAELEGALRRVVEGSGERPASPVSLLTAMKRNTWAKEYAELRRVPANAASLDAIESSLFVLCLDGESLPPRGYSEKDEQARQCLHGGGPDSNSVNRWFDKTIQLVAGPGGYCGMTYEHTPAEGPPVAALMDFILDQFDQRTFIATAAGSPSSPDVTRLDFSVADKQDMAIAKAKRKLNEVALDLEVLTYSFTRFGKNFPKSMKISPDSFIQLAFALAFYRIHGALAPTYETASHRKFSEGRTENIRSPNLQMSKFVQMASDGKTSFTELHDQLQAAIAAHKKYTLECMDGAGMDRHLLAWGLLATEAGLPAPSLLASPVFQRMKHFQVSTSQVPTRHFIQMCFGPSEDDCYGICYNPQEAEFHFTITAFRHFPSTSAKRFAKELEKSLNDLRAICIKGQKERAKL